MISHCKIGKKVQLELTGLCGSIFSVYISRFKYKTLGKLVSSRFLAVVLKGDACNKFRSLHFSHFSQSATKLRRNFIPYLYLLLSARLIRCLSTIYILIIYINIFTYIN